LKQLIENEYMKNKLKVLKQKLEKVRAHKKAIHNHIKNDNLPVQWDEWLEMCNEEEKLKVAIFVALRESIR
jgi:hypothetical protein